MSFLIILGTAAIAYLAICIVGYVKKAYEYDPLYYEPRDLERGDVVKEQQKDTYQKSLEAVEEKKALSHLTNEEGVKSEIHREQVEKGIRESLEGLEAEEKHKTIWEDQERLEKKKRDELLKELEKKPTAK
jgi:chromosome condensin MukBEF MukE localization factor